MNVRTAERSGLHSLVVVSSVVVVDDSATSQTKSCPIITEYYRKYYDITNIINYCICYCVISLFYKNCCLFYISVFAFML